MALSTAKRGILLTNGVPLETALVHSTCVLTELGDYGQVEDCSITNVGDFKEILDCYGNAREALITNPGFEMEFSVLFAEDVDPPAIGTLIAFPYVGVTGVVMPGTEIKWQKMEARMLSIKAKSWNSLNLSESGDAGVWAWTGTSFSHLAGDSSD